MGESLCPIPCNVPDPSTTATLAVNDEDPACKSDTLVEKLALEIVNDADDDKQQWDYDTGKEKPTTNNNK